MDETKLMQVDKGSVFSQTSEKLEDFRKGSCLCDVKIVSADGSEHHAHRVIMAARSEYFQAMFSSNAFAESKNGIVQLDERREIVVELLQYIYTGKVCVTGNNAQELLRAASQYQLPDLFNFLDLHISEHIDLENWDVLWDVAKKLNAKMLLEKLPPFIEKNFGKVKNIENMEGDLIVKISKSDVVPAELYLFQLKLWFTARKDVETTCVALKGMNFNTLCSESLLEMETFFGDFPECMKILYRKVTGRLSSHKLLDLTLSCLISEEYTIVEEGTGKSTFNVRDKKGIGLKFTHEDVPGGILVTQVRGMKRPYLITWLHKGGAYGSYRVHDFSASNSCTVADRPPEVNTDFSFTVCDKVAKGEFSQDQRIYEEEILTSSGTVPVDMKTSGLFGFSVSVTTVGNRTCATVCSTEYTGLVALFLRRTDQISFTQVKELDFFSSSTATFQLDLKEGDNFALQLNSIRVVREEK